VTGDDFVRVIFSSFKILKKKKNWQFSGSEISKKRKKLLIIRIIAVYK